MLKADIRYTTRGGGNLTYVYPAWRAFDEDGCQIADGRTKDDVKRYLASINRKVRSGEYAPRPLYTGY